MKRKLDLYDGELLGDIVIPRYEYLGFVTGTFTVMQGFIEEYDTRERKRVRWTIAVASLVQHPEDETTGGLAHTDEGQEVELAWSPLPTEPKLDYGPEVIILD